MMTFDAPTASPHPPFVSFEIADERVHRYLVDCSAPPDLLRGQAVWIGPNHTAAPCPIPWGLNPCATDLIFGYIVGYDPATRRLEVAPKR